MNFACPDCRGLGYLPDGCCNHAACVSCGGSRFNTSLLDVPSLQQAMNQFASRVHCLAEIRVDGHLIGWRHGDEQLLVAEFVRIP